MDFKQFEKRKKETRSHLGQVSLKCINDSILNDKISGKLTTEQALILCRIMYEFIDIDKGKQ